METSNFKSSIRAAITAGEALEKINNIPGWWGVTFSGSKEKEQDIFLIKMGPDAYFDMTVEEFIPGKKWYG